MKRSLCRWRLFIVDYAVQNRYQYVIILTYAYEQTQSVSGEEMEEENRDKTENNGYSK